MSLRLPWLTLVLLLQTLRGAPGQAPAAIHAPQRASVRPTARRHSSDEHDLRQQVDLYLVDCFARRSAPRVSELADRLELTRVAISAQFHRQNGQYLSDYMKRVQVEYAQELLRGTDLTTARVARAAAFGTRRTFHRAFLQRTGMTPDAFRRSC
ncbi:MAG TPA: helix-turn-helix domain-containing protein [Thermoanaerobaculia bacterium]|nr:helix-turn-helix domain-containing protein [Thermoanaerobaculia bacterium]